jgi:Protein of unknown function (DUF4238)
MNAPRRHHFVPRFSLAYFAGADSLVWVYDAETDTPRPSTPDATGFERDFHTVTGEDGARDTTLETMLAELEGAAAPIYARMVKGQLPKGDDRTMMAQFLAIAYVRSKRMRRTYGEGYGQAMQVVLQRMAESKQAFAAALADVEAEQGLNLSDEERETLRQDMGDWSKYRLSVDREFTLGAFGLAEPITPLIDEMRWSLLTSEDGSFVLSDSPLFKSGAGFATSETMVSLPLSPHTMWMGHWRNDLPEHASLTAERVEGFNLMRAAGADRYLYAPREDSALMAFTKQYVKPRPGWKIGDGDASKLAPVDIRRKR